MSVIIAPRALRKPKHVSGIKWSHPLTRGLVAYVPFVEDAGRPMEMVRKRLPDVPAVLRPTVFGAAMPTANGSTNVSPSYGDIPAYDTPNDLTCACLLDVNSWSTSTSGDFFWSKDVFQQRGWALLNNGAFDVHVGFRVGRSGTNDYAWATRTAVGTGLMLFVGRKTGNSIDFTTVKRSGMTQHMNAGIGGMATPAGADLLIGSTNANGNISVLSCWLWNYPVQNNLLIELFNAPWSMLQERKPRQNVIVFRPVAASRSFLVEAKKGVLSVRQNVVEAIQGKVSSVRTLPVDARGWIYSTRAACVESTARAIKSVAFLVEAKKAISSPRTFAVESKAPTYFQTWPAALPQYPLTDGWKETLAKMSSRTAIDRFPYTQQQRTRAGASPLNQVLQMTSDQLDILWAFYENTLGHGTLTFVATHPMSGDLVRMRFRGGETPAATPIGYDTYNVSLPLEVLPS